MTTPPNLRLVSCCANCHHAGGWMENIWCRKHEESKIMVSWVCDDYKADVLQFKPEQSASDMEGSEGAYGAAV